jgi:hypothetical protein
LFGVDFVLADEHHFQSLIENYFAFLRMCREVVGVESESMKLPQIMNAYHHEHGLQLIFILADQVKRLAHICICGDKIWQLDTGDHVLLLIVLRHLLERVFRDALEDIKYL